MDSIGLAKESEAEGRTAEAAELFAKAFYETEEDWLAVKAGELYASLGETAKARAIFDKIIGCGNYILYDRLLRFYLDIKKYHRAAELFLYLYPDATAHKKMKFADKLLRLGAYDEAAQFYESCIGGTAYEKNRYLTRTGDYDAGRVGYFAQRQLRKGDECFQKNDFKGALNHYLRAAKSCRYAETKAAECWFLLKDYEKAKKAYRDLVQKTDDAYLMFMLAECYNSEDIEANTLENAVYWYEYALENGCKLACYHLGMCYQFGRGTEENIGKAEDLYRTGAELKTDKGECLCKLGNLAYLRGDAEQAAAYYRQAADLDNARALLNIAVGYFNKEIRCFKFAEIRCFLAKSAALGNRRALELLQEIR